MDILRNIYELVDFVFQNPLNLMRRIDIGVVDSVLAKRIKEVSGLDTENFLVSLDNYAILHTFNQHASENEEDEAQIPMTKHDIAKIVEVVFEADNIQYWGKSWATGKDLLRFSKMLGNHFFVVMEVRIVRKKSKKSRLALTTAYIKKVRT